ncbi:MATE family efflux transporter [Vagococcus xieshaowenii]|uniref:Probable multidrug resistance protein NorM n=2 Tax=Vagococcus xieshaowenii TaxID=2562451 RepID=A0AAJ5EHC6_9ENTE|nr:MATE family efflux transporter [Vagococcus xieshaowenii]QCA28851.1 MATE family efflux transporter [Vagococcus xieshaowenii]TFZ43442.1 MATE family efflux transporter [Vagococcus xieshaowenii]
MNKIRGYFTGEGVTSSEIFTILLPVMIDQFFLVSFNFINTAMISSSGQEAISAVNMIGSLNIFLVQIFSAIGLGGTVLIAQTFGKKEFKKLGKLSAGVIHSTFIVGSIIMLLFLIFHQFILGLLFGTADDLVMHNARIYFIGILCSYPAHSIIEGINGSLRGIGKTKESLKNSLIMNTLYLASNFVFVIVLHQGISGLIISLLLSRYLTLGVAGMNLYRQSHQFNLTKQDILSIQPKEDKVIIQTAIPFAAEYMFFNGGKIIMQIMIVSLGTSYIAANAISVSWIQMAEIIPSALSTALVPIIGQAVGRGSIHDIKKLTKTFVLTGMGSFVLIHLVMLPLFPFAMKLFNAPSELIPLIFRIYINTLIMHVLFWSPSFILPSSLRAIGDGVFTTKVSLLTMWLFRVGVGYVVGIKLGYGLIGLFVIMTLEWGIRSIVFMWRFKTGRWQKNIN